MSRVPSDSRMNATTYYGDLTALLPTNEIEWFS